MAAGLPKAIMFTIDVLNYRLTLCISGARARTRVYYIARGLSFVNLIRLGCKGLFIFAVALTLISAVVVFASSAASLLLADTASVNPTSNAAISVVNFPNPFDSRHSDTKIFISDSFPKDKQGDSSLHFRVKIFDLFGYPVRDCGYVSDGVVTWDGRDDAGRKVSKGGYLCVIFSEDGRVSAVKKIGVLH